MRWRHKRLIVQFACTAGMFLANSIPLLADDTLSTLSEGEFQQVLQSQKTSEWSRIHVLTDDQAKLLGESKGFLIVDEPRTRKLTGLWLSGLKSLTQEQTKAVTRSDAHFLLLDGLDSLTLEQAMALSRFEAKEVDTGRLNEFLQEIGLKMGKEIFLLTEKIGILSLNGLTALSEGSAKELGKLKSSELYLNGLKSIDEKVAKQLSKFAGSLIHLNSVQSLTEAEAKALAKCDCEIEMLFLDSASKKLFQRYDGKLKR